MGRIDSRMIQSTFYALNDQGYCWFCYSWLISVGQTSIGITSIVGQTSIGLTYTYSSTFNWTNFKWTSFNWTNFNSNNLCGGVLLIDVLHLFKISMIVAKVSWHYITTYFQYIIDTYAQTLYHVSMTSEQNVSIFGKLN